MEKNYKLLIFIPAKNEAQTIASVISDSRKALQFHLNISTDFLVIDDGSTDTTAHEAHGAGATVLHHKQSKGLGSIFREATEYARHHHYDILVTIDGDKQFNEAEIPSLLAPILSEEAHFVTGSRFLNGQNITNMPTSKKWGNKWAARIISSILNKKYSDVACGFRAYDKKALYHLHMTGNFTYTQEVFLNLGVKDIRIKEVPISVTYFAERKSRIAGNLWRYGKRMIGVILKCLVIYRPMKLFGLLGGICLAFALPFLAIDGVLYLITGSVPYKSFGIASLIVLVISVILLTTGLLLQIFSRMQLTIEETLYHARRKQ